MWVMPLEDGGGRISPVRGELVVMVICSQMMLTTLQVSVITAQRWLVDDGMFGMIGGAKQVICVSGIYDYVL